MTVKKEFSSNSLKEAIALAALEFNTHEDNIKYEIITEKTRYFGHSQREIYIKAWPSDGTEESQLGGFINKLLKDMGLGLKFSVSDGKGFVKVDFNGDDYRLMLYKNGNLLNAVQYLLNRLFSDVMGKKNLLRVPEIQEEPGSGINAPGPSLCQRCQEKWQGCLFEGIKSF